MLAHRADFTTGDTPNESLSKMLLKQDTLRGIVDGSVTLAFRRWRRPTVKAGGTLLTSVGQLAVESVDVVTSESISEAEAHAAGYEDLSALRAQLSRRSEGQVFRIRLSLAGPDPRIALRERIPEAQELEEIVQRLGRLDAHSTSGEWTFRVLGSIEERPGERAAELALASGMERVDFKVKVRKLKGLGLTESLAVGYRLSPRGRAVLAHGRHSGEGGA